MMRLLKRCRYGDKRLTDFVIELTKLLAWVAIDWLIFLIGGIIYGINKKVGTILAIITTVTVVIFVVWGCIYLLPTMTTNDFSWGSLIGGFIGGLSFIPASSKGIEIGESIKRVFKK